MPNPKPTNTTIALQLARIAADLDSEKRTRANTNTALLEEFQGLRKDMQKNFHGDGENPGIFIRLDRIERNSFEEIRKRQEEHERVDSEREKSVNQKFIDVTAQITQLGTEQKTAMAYVKGAMKIVGGLVIVVGLAVSIVEIFWK